MSKNVAADATTRFSTRVKAYVAHRPSYPPAVLSVLDQKYNLRGSRVADLGSGTGILSRLLLELGCTVYGVEPNAEMRAAAEEQLQDYVRDGKFISIAESAEDTGLAKESVDVVVAGQAFHWFDVPKAREECLRIAKAPKIAALMWNDRKREASGVGIMEDYEVMLQKFGRDYGKVAYHMKVDELALRTFFGPTAGVPGSPAPFSADSFPNPYKLDWEGMKGRLSSSSYSLEEGDKGFDEMMTELRRIFDKWQDDGRVDILYETQVFHGPLVA